MKPGRERGTLSAMKRRKPISLAMKVLLVLVALAYLAFRSVHKLPESRQFRREVTGGR